MNEYGNVNENVIEKERRDGVKGGRKGNEEKGRNYVMNKKKEKEKNER